VIAYDLFKAGEQKLKWYCASTAEIGGNKTAGRAFSRSARQE
jgi:hypothetical protein